MSIDRKYLFAALSYVIVGMGFGIYMAASQDHRLHAAHAHILLVGFVTSFIYAVTHKLWLGQSSARVGLVQFVLHHIGTVVMAVGLTLLFGGFYPESVVGPVLGMASITVLLAAVIMFYLCVRAPTGKV